MKDCDCENCILGWEERGQEDCDAGCIEPKRLTEKQLMKKLKI